MLLEEQMRGFMLFGQVANFKTESALPLEKFILALNANLKNSIVIKNAEEVEESFHARYNCKEKTYRYIIDNSKYGSAINRYNEYHISQKLDVRKNERSYKIF